MSCKRIVRFYIIFDIIWGVHFDDNLTSSLNKISHELVTPYQNLNRKISIRIVKYCNVSYKSTWNVTWKTLSPRHHKAWYRLCYSIVSKTRSRDCFNNTNFMTILNIDSCVFKTSCALIIRLIRNWTYPQAMAFLFENVNERCKVCSQGVIRNSPNRYDS